MKEPESLMIGSARSSARWLALVLLTLLAIIGGAQMPVWSAGVTDIIWLESNSTAGNSILAFKNGRQRKSDFSRQYARWWNRRF